MITREEALQYFEYKDGLLYWKIQKKGVNNKKEAGTTDKDGYRVVSVDYKKQRVHRLVFLMHHGYVPNLLDHINGDRYDNRIENLREATVAQNNRNQRISSKNTSGYKGVTWDKSKQKWKVQIKVNGRLKNIGFFEDIELADLVSQEARDLYHKEFANHG